MLEGDPRASNVEGGSLTQMYTSFNTGISQHKMVRSEIQSSLLLPSLFQSRPLHLYTLQNLLGEDCFIPVLKSLALKYLMVCLSQLCPTSGWELSVLMYYSF